MQALCRELCEAARRGHADEEGHDGLGQLLSNTAPALRRCLPPGDKALRIQDGRLREKLV